MAAGARQQADVSEGSLTNMLDRPVVAELAESFGFPEAAERVWGHRREYAEGIFRGFQTEG